MNKRLISVFVFALAVSAGAAFVLYQLISSKVSAGAAANRTPAKTLWVAAKDLDPGALVTDKDLSRQDVINIPPGAITKKEDIINRGVVTAVHKDTPFFEGTLAAPGAGAGFATIIPKGMRALAVKVNEVAGVAGFAVAGMHVDVLVAGTPPNGNGQSVSRTMLQNISVLSAGQNYQKDAEGKPVLVQVVNLLVTPEQAELLNLATDQRIQLVLRNPSDQDIAKTTGAQASNVFDGGTGMNLPVHVDAPKKVVAPRPAAPQPVKVEAPAPAPRPATVEVLSGSSRVQVVMSKGTEKSTTGTAQ